MPLTPQDVHKSLHSGQHWGNNWGGVPAGKPAFVSGDANSGQGHIAGPM